MDPKKDPQPTGQTKPIDSKGNQDKTQKQIDDNNKLE